MVSLSEIRSVIQAVSAPGRHLPLSEFGIGFVPSTHSSASRQARNPVTHGAGKRRPHASPKIGPPPQPTQIRNLKEHQKNTHTPTEICAFPDLVWTEQIRRFAKMLGKLGDASNIGGDGVGCVIADLEILQHPLS